MHSQSRREVQATCHLHSPGALTLGKVSQVPTDWEAGWEPRPVWRFGEDTHRNASQFIFIPINTNK
jgi:hypothetical protein